MNMVYESSLATTPLIFILPMSIRKTRYKHWQIQDVELEACAWGDKHQLQLA